MRVPKLSEEEITLHLAKLPGWTRKDDALSKTYKFKDFSHALGFVNQIAEAAEAADHHPDILIRYNRVTLTLTTHDSGGLTLNDVSLATVSDDFAEGIGL